MLCETLANQSLVLAGREARETRLPASWWPDMHAALNSTVPALHLAPAPQAVRLERVWPTRRAPPMGTAATKTVWMTDVSLDQWVEDRGFRSHV